MLLTPSLPRSSRLHCPHCPLKWPEFGPSWWPRRLALLAHCSSSARASGRLSGNQVPSSGAHSSARTPFPQGRVISAEVRPAPAELDATASQGCPVLADPRGAGGGGCCCGKHTPQAPGSAAQQGAGLLGPVRTGEGRERTSEDRPPHPPATGMLWGQRVFGCGPHGRGSLRLSFPMFWPQEPTVSPEVHGEA